MHPDVLPCPPVDVLIADDDAMLRGSVRSFLEAAGFTCAEAADGPQAVEAARHLIPRCVLLDLVMPGLDGFSVARQLRADPRTVGAHVHCLSGHGDSASRKEAQEAGCELFLTKPVDSKVLLAAVREGTGKERSWTGLTKAAAEVLLDWLEANRFPPAELTYEKGTGFVVRIPEGRGVQGP